MRDLERTLRTATPTIPRAPAELEDRIWATLGYEPAVEVAFDEPLLMVDEAPPSSRRPSRFRLTIGVAAVAVALVAAVLIAGLRNDSTVRPGRAPVKPVAPTRDPRTALGHVYRENSCPDPDRGACFEPFPAGRYTFHKSAPQITITVGDGRRNDTSFPVAALLSRPDTPGALS